MSIPKIDITAPDESHAVAPTRRDPNLTMPGPDQWPAGVMACLKCETIYDRAAGMRQRAEFLMSGEREPVTLERSVKAAPEVGRFTFGPWQEVGRSRVKFTVKIGPRPTGPQTADDWITLIEEHKAMVVTTADIVCAIVQRLGIESEATYSASLAIRGQGQLARALFNRRMREEVARRCEASWMDCVLGCRECAIDDPCDKCRAVLAERQKRVATYLDAHWNSSKYADVRHECEREAEEIFGEAKR